MKKFSLLIALLASPLIAQDKGVWTSPSIAEMTLDYQTQGEYKGANFGVQVIALGNDSFSAVVYLGGLPGDGWDTKNKIILDGQKSGQTTNFKSSTGPRKYYELDAKKFTPVKKFPPQGQQTCTASLSQGTFTLNLSDQTYALTKINRQSPSLGAPAPENAIVLYDGSSNDAFTGGRIDAKTKSLHTDAKDFYTKEKFNNYTMHIEFMTPYMPAYRGAKRGNSGIYQVWDYELQVLDSFGLDGVHSECGGIYKTQAPKINMCYPPLTWQTYDIEFTNSVFKDGKKVSSAFITVKHNGVLVHDKTEIPAKTGGSRKTPEGQPGPFRFQGHGNKIQYRNIWLIKK